MRNFFWESDQKCRLADYLPKLERVTYESRLGSYRDKVERIRALSRWLIGKWFNLGMVQAHVAEADRAAELAKCDPLDRDGCASFRSCRAIVRWPGMPRLKVSPTKSPMPFIRSLPPGRSQRSHPAQSYWLRCSPR